MDRWMRMGVMLLFSVCAIAGCSAETTLADKEVAEFHALFEQGQMTEIYARASQQLKSSSTKSETLAFLEAAHRKLGPLQKTERQTWRVDYNTSGRFATVIYKTQYQRGEAMEQFVYRVKDGTALLVSYNINSPTLVIR